MAAPVEIVGSRLALRSEAEANAFAGTFVATVSALRDLLAAETAALARGRIREALALEERKAELASGYLRAVEAAKANAVALKRLCPAALPSLRAAQDALREAVNRNQTVIATARAVSDGLVKAVADEVAARARPGGYGGGGRPPARATGAVPLALSRSL